MCLLLVKFEEFNTAHTLQTELESFHNCILENKSIIWPVFVSFNFIHSSFIKFPICI